MGGALGKLPAPAEHMVQVASNGSERLSRLINDVLDYERTASGAVEMQVEAVDLQSLCDEAVATFAGVPEPHPGVVVDVGRLTVLADRDRVVQVLVNLLGNAVKFSPAGSTVRIGAAAADGMAEVFVQDEGRGIPVDKLESVFDRFSQVDTSDARDKGGTGLGLAISRTIVERLGGRIWAESGPDRGTTIRFVLPLAQSQTPDEGG